MRLSARRPWMLLFVVLAFVVLAFVATGCTRPPPIGEPALGAVPAITDPEQVTRPIERYLVPVESVVQVATWTVDSINACLRSAGEPANYRVPPGLPAFVQLGRDYERTRSGLWGYFDLAQSRSSGYRDPGGSQAFLDRGPDADLAVFDACKAKTEQAVPGGKGWFGLSLMTVLPNRGPQLPDNDSRWLAAQRDWSQCMAGRGFRYQRAMDASDHWTRDFDGPLTAGEVVTARADFECKVQTNLVGVGAAVQAAYDQRYIEQNQAALTEFQTGVESFLRDTVAQGN